MKATKVALLFPGQGSQAVGMGLALSQSSSVVRDVFAAADDALGFKLSEVIFQGPADELKRTHHTQPAILTMSIAMHRLLQSTSALQGHEVAFVAGHSLGEYSALVAAESMAFGDAVRSVRQRGQFMQDAVPEGLGAMAAVLGLDAATIARVVADTTTAAAYVGCANFNGPEQTVIAGTVLGVQNATAALKTAGAKRVMPLPVSAPFHCALMAPVQPQLDAVLSSLSWSAPRIPVVANVTAQANTSAEAVRGLLVQQVTAPVRFTEMLAHLLGAGVQTFIEVGPGKALTGMVKRMPGYAGQLLLNVEDQASLDATVQALS
jgi:[acyl-carrier-protein] S-malonyltransferase